MEPQTLRHLWRLSVAAVLVVPGAIISCTDASPDGAQGSDAGSGFDGSSPVDGSPQSDASPSQDGSGLGDSSSDGSDADAAPSSDGGTDGGDGGNTDSGDAGCLPSLNPVSRWRFEGNLNDSTGGNNGAFGTVGDAGPGTFVAGKVGNALSLGGNSYFTVLNAANIQNVSPLSVEVWLNPSVIGVDAMTVFRKAYFSVGATLEITSAGNARFNVDNINLTAGAVSSTTLTAGNWYHIVGTADGTNVRIFVNGAESGSEAQPASSNSSNYDLFVGASAVPPSGAQVRWQFSGLIDEMAFYNRALSASEILATYQAGSLGRCP